MPSEENGNELLGDRDAMTVMRAAADIVQHRHSSLLRSGPAAASHALLLLHRAALDVGDAGLMRLEPARRLELLDRSLRELEPAMEVARIHDADWLRNEFASPVHELRAHLQLDAARARVERAILLPCGDDVAEIPTDGLSDENAGAHALALLAGVDKLLETYAILDAQIVRLGRERFDRAFAGMEPRWGSDMLPMDRRRFNDVDTARSSLRLLRQLLAVPAAHELTGADVIERRESFTDLVQLAIAISGGVATLAAAVVACAAELDGELQVAAELTTIAAAPALELAHVVAAIDLVHGVVVVLDATAGADARLRGAVDIGAGMAWFAGSGIESPRVGGAISGLVAVGYLIGQAGPGRQASVDGAAADLRLFFGFLANHSVVIREQSVTLMKARLLLARTTEPGEHQALSQVVGEVTQDLDLMTRSCLDACLRADSVGSACPGRVPYLHDAFTSLHDLLAPGADPGAALHNATAVVERMSQVLDDAPRYERLAAADEPD